MGFSVFTMLLLLAYSGYRLYVRREYLTMAVVCLQLFAISILAVGFIRNVQSENIVEAICMFFGVFVPAVFLVIDYVKMFKRIKEYGTFEGLVESVKFEIENLGEFSKAAHLCPIIRERQVPELVNHLNVNKDEIVKNVKKSLSQAHFHIDRGEFKEAHEIYNILTKIVSNSPGMYFNYGNLCYRLDLFGGALSAYRKALEVSEKQVRRIVEPNVVLDPDAIKKPSRAKSLLFKTSDDFKYDDFIVFFNLGNTYFRLNRFREAIDAYEKAINLNHGLDEARENIARCLIMLDKKAEAMEYYKNIVENDSKNYYVHYTYGRLLAEQREFEQAIESLNRAFELNSAHTEALNEISKIQLGNNEHEAAILTLKRILKKDPNDYAAHYNIGLSNFLLGKTDEATKSFKKVLEIKNDHHNSLFNLGVIMDEKDNVNEAISYFREAIEAKDDFIKAYNNLGIILSTQGRYMEALEVYVRGLKKNPEEASLYFNMGITLEEMGRYDDAESAYRNAIDIDPTEDEVNLHLASVVVQLKKYEEAVEIYKQVLKNKPEDSVIYYYMASANSMQKKYEIAIDNLRKAISIDPSLKEEAKVDRAFDTMKSRNDFRKVVA